MKKTEVINFRCSPELKEILDKTAKEEDRTISYIVNRILENYISRKSSSTED